MAQRHTTTPKLEHYQLVSFVLSYSPLFFASFFSVFFPIFNFNKIFAPKTYISLGYKRIGLRSCILWREQIHQYWRLFTIQDVFIIHFWILQQSNSTKREKKNNQQKQNKQEDKKLVPHSQVHTFWLCIVFLSVSTKLHWIYLHFSSFYSTSTKQYPPPFFLYTDFLSHCVSTNVTRQFILFFFPLLSVIQSLNKRNIYGWFHG